MIILIIKVFYLHCSKKSDDANDQWSESYGSKMKSKGVANTKMKKAVVKNID